MRPRAVNNEGLRGLPSAHLSSPGPSDTENTEGKSLKTELLQKHPQKSRLAPVIPSTYCTRAVTCSFSSYQPQRHWVRVCPASPLNLPLCTNSPSSPMLTIRIPWDFIPGAARAWSTDWASHSRPQ